MLRDALGARPARADDLPTILAALLPWAMDDERMALADESVLVAADLIAHAGRLHPQRPGASNAHRRAASKLAHRVEAWAGTVLESERLERRTPREGAGEGAAAREENVQTTRLRSLRTARLLREVAGRPAAQESTAGRESKAGEPQQATLQASHTTTMSSSAAPQHSSAQATAMLPTTQPVPPVMPPAQAESARILVYLHAQTADPATRAHQLLALFRDATVPLDAVLCQMARNALAQHPQSLPLREDKQGKASPLGPQYRTLTSRLVALYEHFLTGGHLADPRSFLEGELAWAQRMDKPGPGNPLAGQLTQVIASLRQRLGLEEPAEVD